MTAPDSQAVENQLDGLQPRATTQVQRPVERWRAGALFPVETPGQVLVEAAALAPTA